MWSLMNSRSQKEIEIGYDEEQEEMVVKIPIPTNEDSYNKQLEYHKDHPKGFGDGSPLEGVQTWSGLNALNLYWAFLSKVVPKNFKQAEKKES